MVILLFYQSMSQHYWNWHHLTVICWGLSLSIITELLKLQPFRHESHHKQPDNEQRLERSPGVWWGGNWGKSWPQTGSSWGSPTCRRSKRPDNSSVEDRWRNLKGLGSIRWRSLFNNNRVLQSAEMENYWESLDFEPMAAGLIGYMPCPPPKKKNVF